MKDTKKELENKVQALENAFVKVGQTRFALHLDCNDKREEQLFMQFIRLQNAITDYENEVRKEIEKIPW